MTVVSITRFEADPADAAEVRARHTALVSAIRSAPAGGLTEARLGRTGETSWVGIWRWESQESLLAARRDAPGSDAATRAFALVRDVTAEDVELVDEH